MSKKRFVRDLEDDFIITCKRRIRDVLTNDTDIPLLLRDADGSVLYDENSNENYDGIYPFVFVPTTQSEETCYICFQISSYTPEGWNPYYKNYNITFVVFCSARKEGTGMEANRTDAISYCIKDIFNWSNIMGLTWELRTDEESILTTGYIARTMIFYSQAYAPQTHSANTRSDDGYLRKELRNVNTAVEPGDMTLFYTDPDV